MRRGDLRGRGIGCAADPDLLTGIAASAGDPRIVLAIAGRRRGGTAATAGQDQEKTSERAGLPDPVAPASAYRADARPFTS